MHSFEFTPIGIIHSCYKEKFGIPRQANLVEEAKAHLILNEQFSPDSVWGLDGFSHIWLQFIFHQTCQNDWKEMIRPPRLGGNKKVGVFASRSTYRPNAMGLSAVTLDDIDMSGTNVVLHLSGIDLVDQTPILDIKPYLPYADSIANAVGGFAHEAPQTLFEVVFSETASLQCELASERLNENIQALIVRILTQDPRPSYQQNKTDKKRIYAMSLYDFDLKWQYCENNKINVLGIT